MSANQVSVDPLDLFVEFCPGDEVLVHKNCGVNGLPKRKPTANCASIQSSCSYSAIQLGTPQLAVFCAHERAVACVSYSPDGAQIASGSEDNTVRVSAVAGSPRRNARWLWRLAFVPPLWKKPTPLSAVD
jgi:WD40 repeat protein